MAENLDGPLITQWARRAAAGLRERQAEINRLNVFPIPDSDTGSNMAYTMTAAVDSADQANSEDVQDVTTALASGAVRGARGNSGMVLSQVLRALSDTASRGKIDSQAVAKMLQLSVDFVKTSISSPVEGTILTVLRAAAEGAASGRASLTETVGQALHAAEVALEQTPTQLDVLAKAGVVDAGGRGLVVILQSLYDTLSGEVGASRAIEGMAEESAGAEGEADPTDAAAADDSSPEEDPATDPEIGVHGSGSEELEVMFMFDASADPSSFAELRAFLDRRGNSLVIAQAGDNLARVHIHTRFPGAVIERAFELGGVSDLRLEVLPDSEFPSSTIIALAPTGGVASIFENAGAITLDVEHASAQEVRDLLAMSGTGSLVVLTNGRDASSILNQGFDLSAIDTSSLVGGLAALAVHDPANDHDDDVEDMVDAVSAQRFCTSTADAMIADLDELLSEGGELVTLLWSTPEVSEDEMDKLRAHMQQQHPDIEFHDYPAEGMAADSVGHVVEIGVE